MFGVALVPLLLVGLALAPFAAAAFSRRADLAVTRVALVAFGDHVSAREERRRSQQGRIRAAHVGLTHREYASKTLLYAAVAGLVGSVLGVYGMGLLLTLLRVRGEAVRAALPTALSFLANLTRVGELTPGDLFPLLLVSSATVGVGSALSAYALRWELLDQRAAARASRIEATLPRTVAFVYALSRSGMPFPRVLDTLTENRAVYGEAARELGVAVREMNTFGTDVLTALERMAERTPSENMGEFGDNLASVLASGQDVSAYLRGQYERYQEEAESRQEQYLELLSTFAEAYVTVLVAGPLFLVTILVVVGLVLSDTRTLLRVVVYVVLPLASAGFVVYVDSITRTGGGVRRTGETLDPRLLRAATVRAVKGETDSQVDGGPADGELTDPGVTDGGVVDSVPPAETTADGRADIADRWTDSRERLAAYDRYDRVFGWLARPVDVLLERPAMTMALTVPVGLWWVRTRVGAVPREPGLAVRALDSPVVEATLLVLVCFAAVYELEKRRTRAVERAVPDLLDRMASINEAGLTVVESLRRLARSDLDRLTPEVRRTWRDVQWGADVATALDRMDGRVGSPMVSRAVALVTNAVSASGEVSPVLEIAADETRATRRLRRERRQVMLTYLLVIYVSFAVFLGIVAALSVSFVPAIENAALGASAGGVGGFGASTGVFGASGDVPTEGYVLLFYHASVIQASCSGVVAGQLGEGRPADGLKHASVMLAAAHVAFTLIGA